MNPTNPWALCSSLRGPMMVPIIKSTIAPKIMAIRKFWAFDSHSIPIAQIMIITKMATTPTILTSLRPPSTIFKPYLLSKSLKELQKPIVFIEAETAFAKANTMPTEAPNSGPRDLEMM